MPILDQIRQRWALDPLTAWLFGFALLGHGLAWWLRSSGYALNLVVFQLAGGILLLNGLLTVVLASREPFLGYILTGAALLTQLLLLILILAPAGGR